MSNVQISTLKFTAIASVKVAHSAGCVSFINAGDERIILLHTKEGGVVPIKDISQLEDFKEGQAFELDIEGNIKPIKTVDVSGSLS